MQQILIIFDKNDSKLCYEYRFDKGSFLCSGCFNQRISTRAKLFDEETNKEYLELYSVNHICKYNPKTLFPPETTLQKPAYEIQTVIKKEKEIKKSIIFDTNERKYCHEYIKVKSRFVCSPCQRKNQHVYAKLAQNESGNEYLRVSSNPHICKRRLNIPESDKNFICLDFSKFKIHKPNAGKRQIFLFDENDSKMGYEFHLTSRNLFYCFQCKKQNHSFMIKLIQKRDNSFYLRMKGNQKHICNAISKNMVQ